MSAKARLRLPLLWAVKMSGFFAAGRGRPGLLVVVGGVEVRREERVDVKARLEEGVMVVGLVVRGRGRP